MLSTIRQGGKRLFQKLPAPVQEHYWHWRTSKVSPVQYLRFTDEAMLLSLLSFRPRLILDIGANHGEWTVGFRGLLGETTHFYLFEPTPHLNRELNIRFGQYPNVHIYPLAMSSDRGEATFNVSLQDDLSSLEAIRSINGFNHTTTEAVTVMTETLDHFHETVLHGAEIDLIKLDTQGHEYAILSAAAEALSHTKALLIEWNIVHVYDSSSDFITIHKRLEELGFVLSSIVHQARWGEQLAWADALYVNSRFLSIPTQVPTR